MPENVRFGLPPEIVATIMAGGTGHGCRILSFVFWRDCWRHDGRGLPFAEGPASAPQMRFGKIDDLGSRVAVAVDAARNYLFSQQHEEGYWCGELEADTTLESDYILLHTLLGTGNQARFDKAARYILNHQNADGGWSIYAAGPSDISASVKAGFGLKLAGFTADHPALVRARKKILDMGGVTEVTTFTAHLSLLLRAVRLRCSAGGRTGNCSVSELVSGSIFTKFLPGRAPSSCRFRSATRRSHSKRFPMKWEWKSFFVGGREKSRMHLHWAKNRISWRNFFLVLDRLYSLVRARAYSPAVGLWPCGAPRSGCSSALR